MSADDKISSPIPYDLRPKKQVERRMIIDLMQVLNGNGFAISEYQYTGFGNFYFIDFILFHKFLNINNMLSIEHDIAIEKRVRFNKPYKLVQIEIASAEEVIPKLDVNINHILWLDYDRRMDAGMLKDISLAAGKLNKQSIVFVTIDSEPPYVEDDKPYTPPYGFDHYSKFAEQYLGPYTNIEDFGETNLRRINVEIFKNIMSSNLSARGLEFFPLINFSYADGRHQMITCGGMICSGAEKRRLIDSQLKERPYIRFDLDKEPYEIRVPMITRKERLCLDSYMPCEGNWKPEEFDLPNDEILAYKEIYRYFPAYAEMML
jgi:hypothetical protein